MNVAGMTMMWWRDLWSDVRYGLRAVAKRSGFAAVAVCSLGLGIGANTAIFSATKTILLDSLKIPHPEQLRLLRWEFPGSQPMNSLHGDLEQTKSGATTSTSFSYPVYQALKEHAGAFENLTALEPESRRFVATIDGEAEPVSVQMVSGSFFPTLGVTAAAGRTLLPSDDVAAGSGAVVVISDTYWRERFGRSITIIGKVIEVNRISVAIVGVTPPGFVISQPNPSPDMFMPLTMQPVVNPLIIDGVNHDQFTDGQRWWVAVLARVKPRVTDAQALASLEGVFAQTVKDTLRTRRHIDLDRLHLRLSPGNQGVTPLNNEFSETADVLMVVVGLVLMLACANLANLLLARSASRRREVSVRIALGGRRSRIIRQLLTESMLLAFLGGGLGLVLGYLGRNIIPHVLRQVVAINFDWQVLAFTFVVSLLTGLLFGGLPAWQATQTDMQSGLQDTARATRAKSKAFLGKSLVVVQVSLSAMLLIGAGLFLRTLDNLMHTRLGFQPEHLLLFDVSLPKTQYKTDESRAAIFDQLQTQVAALPGIRTATFSSSALLAGDTSTTNFDPNGDASANRKTAWLEVVGVNYFQTMGIPLIAGRGFSEDDSDSSPKVAIINMRLARELFHDENPLGKTFNNEHIRIVGICGDAKFKDLRTDPPATYYLLYRQSEASNNVTFAAKTSVLPGSLTGSIRSIVQSLDKDLPITNVRTQEEQIDDSLREEKLFARLTSGFGFLAVLLASIGIYGVTAYTVAGRTSEIGVRLALGAQRSQVLRMILREACWLAVAGIGISFVASLTMGHLVQSFLYGLRFNDPLTLAGVAALLIAITLIASWMPAQRAAQVDPINALRHE